jgi:pimeloyl-ACP methyl ester carboxylesterase
VKALVYLCAFLPGNGESLGMWAQQYPDSVVTANLMPVEEHVVIVRPEAVHEAFYAHCPVEDEAFAVRQLKPQGVEPFGAPVSTTAEGWGRIPRYYVECVRDRAIPLPLQQAMHRNSPCRKVFTIDTDHSPFFSAPEELAGILMEIGAE